MYLCIIHPSSASCLWSSWSSSRPSKVFPTIPLFTKLSGSSWGVPKTYSLQWVLGLPRGFLQLVVAGKTPKGSQPGGVRIRSPNHLSYLDVLIFWWCGYFGSPPVAWHKPGLSRYQISTRRLLWPKKFIITISLQNRVCVTINVCYCL